MVSSLKEIEGRLLAVMPLESTIDRAAHALAVASVVFEARRQAARRREDEIAETRAHSEMTRTLTRLLNERLSKRER
jgi:HPt (histidine-containing phosphotransfer) domain-containing protein